MERGETLAEAAARELHEESGVLLPADQLQLYMTGTITFINQVYIAFRARVDTDYCLAGPESLDCGFLFEGGVPLGGSRLPRGSTTQLSRPMQTLRAVVSMSGKRR